MDEDLATFELLLYWLHAGAIRGWDLKGKDSWFGQGEEGQPTLFTLRMFYILAEKFGLEALRDHILYWSDGCLAGEGYEMGLEDEELCFVYENTGSD